MKYFIGIDDSGRGPVIGPMILAGILADEKQIKILKELGAKDSKMITPRRRELLAKRIKKFIAAHYIVKVPPQEIDHQLNSGINLNKVEAIKAAEIINLLMKKVDELKLKEIGIIIDCPSVNRESWKDYLMKHIIENKNVKINMRCEHKADVNHAIVSAASILGKVTRDAEIEKIKIKYGIECGSGYPADPLCKKFLREQGDEFAERGIVRKTWQTWKNHVNKKTQKRLKDF